MPNTYTIEQIKVAPGYVVVRPQEVGETVAGIYQPNKEKEVPQWGVVISVGARNKDAGDLDLKPGQTVVYKKWQTNDVKVGDKKYYFLKYDEIIGVVE